MVRSTPPPTEKGVLSVPGQAGGADWAGGAANSAQRACCNVPSHMAITTVQLNPVDDPEAHSAFLCPRQRVCPRPSGSAAGQAPVQGSITAIDLNTGEHTWRTTVGKGPVDHPALKGARPAGYGLGQPHFRLGHAESSVGHFAGPASYRQGLLRRSRCVPTGVRFGRRVRKLAA